MEEKPKLNSICHDQEEDHLLRTIYQTYLTSLLSTTILLSTYEFLTCVGIRFRLMHEAKYMYVHA